jgi:hypothetical protein
VDSLIGNLLRSLNQAHTEERYKTIISYVDPIRIQKIKFTYSEAEDPSLE